MIILLLFSFQIKNKMGFCLILSILNQSNFIKIKSRKRSVFLLAAYYKKLDY